MATVGPDGLPHVVPVGWRYNADTDTIDVTGRRFAATRKFHNARANPKVAIVVDDVLPPMIRITPVKVISWGLDEPTTPG